MTQPSVKPNAGAVAGDANDALKTSLRFVIALFANLGDLDEIFQLLGISDWHSLVFNSVMRNFTGSSSQCFEAPTALIVAVAEFLPN